MGSGGSACRGLFITFEGPEGAGKTTQIGLLAAWLEARGRECVTTREPGGTAIGEELRRILKHHQGPLADATEVLLFAAARAQHVHELIRPALARGAVVLCDRFADSTMAYQGHARDIDRELIRRLNDFAVGAGRPDLTLLLDLPPQAGMVRARRRGADPGGADRIEAEAEDFHARVRAGFLAIAREEPGRVKVIDATPPPDQVQAQIREVVRHALGLL